ncbi:FMN phosphatase YigB (HAD superfamily) [Lachnospiraceae bacterium PFB1-21]|uniref:HAD family hydrolase n=1 Tax=Ohessyouella blattaphilus TaxID=2949333 RepID=UPI003E261DEE
MKNTILFDLDGTLLPFDQGDFITSYFSKLTSHLAREKACDQEMLTKVIWAGTKAIVENDGSMSNRERFFQTFVELTGWDISEWEALFLGFYQGEFDQVKEVLGKSYGQPQMLQDLRYRGFSLVLATAPLFPEAAVSTRLSWIGLGIDDFDYVTTYENSTYCKPSTAYYREVLEKIGKRPEDCLMIGNNIREDMVAEALGIKTFLVNEYLENPEKADPSVYQNGNFEELKIFLQNL